MLAAAPVPPALPLLLGGLAELGWRRGAVAAALVSMM
jgi:hypothetical protein